MKKFFLTVTVIEGNYWTNKFIGSKEGYGTAVSAMLAALDHAKETHDVIIKRDPRTDDYGHMPGTVVYPTTNDNIRYNLHHFESLPSRDIFSAGEKAIYRGNKREWYNKEVTIIVLDDKDRLATVEGPGGGWENVPTSFLQHHPKVGMGVTFYIGSDSTAGTIVKVSPSGKTITVRHDEDMRIDTNGPYTEDQNYLYYNTRPENQYTETYRRDQKGNWSRGGRRVTLGVRRRHFDPTF